MGFDAAAFFRMAGQFGHTGHLALRLVDQGPDWAEVALPWSAALAAEDEGGIAAGPVVSLMDMACSLGVWARRGAFAPQVTLDLRLDHLRDARAGAEIVGRGECHRLAGAVAFVRGSAHDGDPADPVATVAGTFMLTGDTWR